MGPEPLDRGAEALPRPVGPDDWRERLQALRDDLVDRLDGGRLGRAAVGVLLATVGALALWWAVTPPGEAEPIEDSLPALDSGMALGAQSTPPTQTPTPTLVVVHVAGAVRSPGLIQTTAAARVADAIAAAGGAAPDAELDRINLAAPVADGQQIYVPVAGEALPPSASPAAGTDPTGPVDINTATAQQLDSLPGVGPTTAANIVAHRDANGPFANVSALEDVPGIGPAKLAQLRDLVTVGGTP